MACMSGHVQAAKSLGRAPAMCSRHLPLAAVFAIALLASACRSGPHSVSILGTGASGEPVTTQVSVLTGGTELLVPVASCQGTPVATVKETNTEVRITVKAST